MSWSFDAWIPPPASTFVCDLPSGLFEALSLFSFPLPFCGAGLNAIDASERGVSLLG